MNEMYEYLSQHSYISDVKTCNRYLELTKDRAECIANKYNSLVEEKDKEIERLNNKINKFAEDFEDYLFSNPLVSLDDYYRKLDYILMLERDMPDVFNFIKTIKGLVEELKRGDEE